MCKDVILVKTTGWKWFWPHWLEELYKTRDFSRGIKHFCHRGSLEILRGRGVLKSNICKGMYESKLEFREGWGFKPKDPPWGEYGYFLEQHNT